MNGYQRVLNTLQGKPVDRLAAMPITMMLAADVIGVPYGDYVADHRLLVKGQLATAREFGFDHVSAISDPAREAADLGADVHFYPNAPPALNEANALLTDKSRLESLRPLDPLKPGSRTNDRIDGVRALATAVKNELCVEGWIEGPCAEAADLRGINALMLDFIDDPEFVRRLFAVTTENALRFAAEQIKAGADIIGVGDAAASLVGPRIFRDFVFPHEKKLIDGIHALGGRVRLHICGNTSRSLREIAALGVDFADIDWMVPLEKVREEAGPDFVIAGNIDPVKALRNASAEQVYESVARCHAIAGSRFIIAAGCEIPRDTPRENIHAMVRYARSPR